MKWHYLKDNDYPNWYAGIIVKCADGEVLKTGAWSYDDDEYYNHKSFAVCYYDDEGFNTDMGSLCWINVVAWYYVKDVYDELQDQENKEDNQ